MELLRASFPVNQVKAEQPAPDKQAEYEKRALENIAGSMVFVERRLLKWDGK